jgi:hypothetical protein
MCGVHLLTYKIQLEFRFACIHRKIKPRPPADLQRRGWVLLVESQVRRSMERDASEKCINIVGGVLKRELQNKK